MTTSKVTSISQLWYQRMNMTTGVHGSLYSNIENIAGVCVFGKNRGKTKKAYELLFKYIETTENMECFLTVEPGKIITNTPSHEDLFIKLLKYVNRSIEYYKNKPLIMVKDKWALGDIYDGSPLNKKILHHSRLLERSEKRFIGKTTTLSEHITELVTSSTGMLCEGYVIAFLNTLLPCPECNTIGHIGWCDAMSHRSIDAFRDAICMNCKEKNIITLYEIKTRWECGIQKNKDNGTYAGSFAAINALMKIKANVHLVVVSRDTGDIRIGKITSAKLRGNKNWLYSLQEGLEWGSPSSYVYCDKGLEILPKKMKPLIDIDKNIKSVIEEVIKTCK